MAGNLTNLAGVLLDLGEVAGARRLLEQALAVFEARLPADHPHIGLVRESLSALAPRVRRYSPGS